MTREQLQPLIYCAGYGRFSSEIQDEKSIDAQFRNIIAYANQQGWIFLEEYRFADRAMTGTAQDRPQLQALIACALKKNPPFQYILVDDTSRLARDPLIAATIARKLKANGVFMVFIAQSIDTASDHYEDFLLINGITDAKFLRNLKYKTHSGLKEQAIKGRATGGKVYGYKTTPITNGRADAHGIAIPDGYDPVIDPAEAKNVRRIFQLFADNALGHGKIAKLLNSEHVPSPRFGQRNDRKGWSHTTIRAMLRNERYIGTWTWNKTKWDHEYQRRKRGPVSRPRKDWIVADRPDLAIIDPTLWAKAQDRLKHVERAFGERRRGRFVQPGNRAAVNSLYLLSGLLCCGTCGGNMVVTGGDRGGKDGRRYGCSTHSNMGSALCTNSKSINILVAEAMIAEKIQERLLTPQRIEEAAEILREELAAALREMPVHDVEIQRSLDKIEREINYLMRAVKEGRYSRSVEAELEAAELRQDELRAELVRVQATPKAADIVLAPNAARNMIENITNTLKLEVPAAKEALRLYLDGRITMRPIVKNGVKDYVAECKFEARKL